MAGWKTSDMLDGIEGIMNLAAASGEDLATTSDIVTDALTAFGLPSQMLYYCQALEEAVFPKVSTVNSGVFNYCTNLTKIDLGGAITRLSSAFMAYANKVTALILRGVTTVPTLGSTTFNNTAIKSGTCYVYVPKELEATFKVASNWSTYASQIRAIEDYPEICG